MTPTTPASSSSSPPRPMLLCACACAFVCMAVVAVVLMPAAVPATADNNLTTDLLQRLRESKPVSKEELERVKEKDAQRFEELQRRQDEYQKRQMEESKKGVEGQEDANSSAPPAQPPQLVIPIMKVASGHVYYDIKTSLANAVFWKHELLSSHAPMRGGKWKIITSGGSQMFGIVEFLCGILSDDDAYRTTYRVIGPTSCKGKWGNVEINVEFYYGTAAIPSSWNPGNVRDGADPAANTIFIFDGAAVHLTHLLPKSEWTNFEHWKNYATDIVTSVDHLVRLGVPAIFLTTAHLCEDKQPEETAWVSQACHTHSSALDAACEKELAARVGRLHVHQYCYDGCRTSRTIDTLYQKEVGTVSRYPRHQLRLIDMMTLTKNQCWAASHISGFTYPPLVPGFVANILAEVRHHIEAAVSS